jgi:hypothetical protein
MVYYADLWLTESLFLIQIYETFFRLTPAINHIVQGPMIVQFINEALKSP